MSDVKIGEPVISILGKDMVQGKLKYATDLSFPGMLHGKTVRCPYPHAKVISIDTSKAQKMDGVIAVVTAKDIEGVNLHGQEPFIDQPVLVGEGEIAKMVGDPIAVVAAISEEIAENAIALIEVEYEELEGVHEPEKVLRSPAQHLIHATAFCGDFNLELGDIEQGVKRADFVVEDTYKLPIQEHAYIETESCVAIPEYDGSLTVIGCSHDPHFLRNAIAKSLRLSENSVRVTIPPIGGSFGGKQSITVHILTALLAKKLDRTVKMVLTREESMVVSAKRHPGRVTHRLGATKDGRITFLQVDYLLDGGPYSWATQSVTSFMGIHFAGPYDIPNISIQGKAVYTNNPMAAAFRGYGGPQAVTVTEMQVDRLAKKVGLDPVEFREKNFITEADGQYLDGKVTSNLLLQKAVEKAGPLLAPSEPKKRVGRGVASAVPAFSIGSVGGEGWWRGTGASIEVFRDGSVEIRTGVVEMGTGITTTVAQIVSHELGVSFDNLKVVFANTEGTLKQGPTTGSRSTYTTGHAVRMAAQELRKRLADAAAHKFGIFPSAYNIEFADNSIYFRHEKNNLSNSLAEIAGYCYENGINLAESSWFVCDHAEFGRSYVAAVVDVEVDTVSGEISVLNCIIAHDCGKVINPLNAKAQLIGAGLQGIGYALMEDMVVSKGRVISKSFNDYMVPMSLDVPKIEVVLIEERSPTGPYGARGLAEHATNVTPPALLNAVSNAIGKDITEFPLTPHRVFSLIHDVT